eukprot:UN28232
MFFEFLASLGIIHYGIELFRMDFYFMKISQNRYCLKLQKGSLFIEITQKNINLCFFVVGISNSMTRICCSCMFGCMCMDYVYPSAVI